MRMKIKKGWFVDFIVINLFNSKKRFSQADQSAAILLQIYF